MATQTLKLPNAGNTEAAKAATSDTQKITYINEKPELPAETNDIKFEIKEVTRTVKTVNSEETTGKYILTPVAKTTDGMVAIAEGNLEKALNYFNTGYFSALRTKASNELAGGSEEDRAFAKILKAVKNLPMFSGKTEDQITEAFRSQPALMAMFGK